MKVIEACFIFIEILSVDLALIQVDQP